MRAKHNHAKNKRLQKSKWKQKETGVLFRPCECGVKNTTMLRTSEFTRYLTSKFTRYLTSKFTRYSTSKFTRYYTGKIERRLC